MRDVQNQADARGIAIQRVGIKDAQLPFLIKTKDGGFQQVLARILFTVALPMEYKGTHMSRFLLDLPREFVQNEGHARRGARAPRRAVG